MTEHDWHAGYARTLGVYLNGEGIPERDPLGGGSSTTRSCCCSTPTTSATTFTLPARLRADVAGRRGHRGPAAGPRARKERDAKPGGRLRIPARSLLVLQRRY
jgi:glycogen operon protein